MRPCDGLWGFGAPTLMMFQRGMRSLYKTANTVRELMGVLCVTVWCCASRGVHANVFARAAGVCEREHLMNARRRSSQSRTPHTYTQMYTHYHTTPHHTHTHTLSDASIKVDKIIGVLHRTGKVHTELRLMFIHQIVYTLSVRTVRAVSLHI